MKKIVVAAIALMALSACSGGQALLMDTDSTDGQCNSIAGTGDMYRYCQQYGPEQAALALQEGGGRHAALLQAAAPLTK